MNKKPFLHDRNGFFLYTLDMSNEINKKTVPTVVRAKVLGYCMGVRRAMEGAHKAATNNSRGRVWTLGPLIHNKTALDMLASEGVQILKDDDFTNIGGDDVVVIRAHGVTPAVKANVTARSKAVVDATCPRVMLSQKRVADFAAKGYTVIIAGDKNHGEVTGIAGCAQAAATGTSHCVLVGNKQDAMDYVEEIQEGREPLPEKAMLLCQTTISRSEYDAIQAVLTPVLPGLEVFDTICPATTERQDALADLQGQVDGVLIIGGKHSANTQRLLTSAQRYFDKAALIETADEIPPEFFALQRVGLSAGASTPDEVIDEVERRLLQGAMDSNEERKS